MANPGTGRAQVRRFRLPPARGNIKREIFSSMAALILHALKRIEISLVKLVHCAMAAFSCKICCPGKATSTASALDLLGELRP